MLVVEKLLPFWPISGSVTVSVWFVFNRMLLD